MPASRYCLTRVSWEMPCSGSEPPAFVIRGAKSSSIIALQQPHGVLMMTLPDPDLSSRLPRTTPGLSSSNLILRRIHFSAYCPRPLAFLRSIVTESSKFIAKKSSKRQLTGCFSSTLLASPLAFVPRQRLC